MRRRLSALVVGFALLALLVAFLSPAAGAAAAPASHRRPHPLRRQHAGQARRHPDRGRADAGRPRTTLAQTAPRPDPEAVTPDRPEPRAADRPAPQPRPLLEDLGEGQPGDGAARHPGRIARPALDLRRPRRHLQDRRGGRPQALRARTAETDAPADRGRRVGGQAASEGDADPRRRPRPLRLPPQQLGRQHRQRRGRRTGDRRGAARAPASSGSPTKSWSPKTRT